MTIGTRFKDFVQGCWSISDIVYIYNYILVYIYNYIPVFSLLLRIPNQWRQRRTPTISQSASNIKSLHIVNRAGLFNILFGLHRHKNRLINAKYTWRSLAQFLYFPRTSNVSILIEKETLLPCLIGLEKKRNYLI